MLWTPKLERRRPLKVDAAAVLLPVPVTRGLWTRAPADLPDRGRGGRRHARRRHLPGLLLRRTRWWNAEFGQNGRIFTQLREGAQMPGDPEK
jgi:hypothetical protein